MELIVVCVIEDHCVVSTLQPLPWSQLITFILFIKNFIRAKPNLVLDYWDLSIEKKEINNENYLNDINSSVV